MYRHTYIQTDRQTNRINHQKTACENRKLRKFYTPCFYCQIKEVNVGCRTINNAPSFLRFEIDKRILAIFADTIPDFKIM